VVLKKECVVVLDVGLKRIGNLHGGGSTVLTGRNVTDGENRLGKDVLVKIDARNGECGSNGGMRVNNGVNVGALLIYSHVHLDLGGGIELALKLVTVSVNLDDHIGGKGALGYAGGGAVILVLANLNGDVTVVSSYEAEVVDSVTYLTDFFLDFVR
jgi:hypothetical protein